MDSFPSIFDVIVGCIMLASVTMAIFRGFVKEFFTIVSWIAATLITIYLSPVVQNLFDPSEGKKAFYDAISVLVIFSLSMLFISMIFAKFVHFVRKNDEMLLDRSLGALFGIVRGALLICLGYIFIVGFIYNGQPSWLKGRTVKLVQIGSEYLIKLNPKNIEFEVKDIIPLESKANPTKLEDGGYSKELRQRIDELVEEEIYSK